MVAFLALVGWIHSLVATTNTGNNGSSSSSHPPPVQSKSIGIPVGTVELPLSKIHSFRELLQTVLGPPHPSSSDQPLLRFRGMDKHANNNNNNNTATIHLPPVAAALLEDENPQLVQFLQTNHGIYRSGVRRQCPTKGLELTPRMASASCKEVHNNNNDHATKFRFVELFAGMGGFRLGLEEIGGTCVLANELNPQVATMYQQNFPTHGTCDSNNNLAIGDILDLDTANIPHHDMLVGGFPCQPFSLRGRRPGLEDANRGHLYRELARILAEKQPRCFLFENVPGLVTLGTGGCRTASKGQLPHYQAGTVFRQILDTFAGCGYDVDWKVLNARKWLPQMRERVYIVGTRQGLQCPPMDWRSLVLEDLRNESPLKIRDILEPKTSPSVAAAALTNSQYTRLLRKRRNNEPPIRLLDLNGKAPTLISSYHSVSSSTSNFLMEEADGTRRSIPRFLTPRECTRLMGLPEDFCLPDVDDSLAVSRYYQAIGNAVCPIAISSIGKELMKCVAQRQ